MSSYQSLKTEYIFYSVKYRSTDQRHKADIGKMAMPRSLIQKIRDLGASILPQIQATKDEFEIKLTPILKGYETQFCCLSRISYTFNGQVTEAPKEVLLLLKDDEISDIGNRCFKQFPEDKAIFQEVLFTFKNKDKIPMQQL